MLVISAYATQYILVAYLMLPPYPALCGSSLPAYLLSCFSRV